MEVSLSLFRPEGRLMWAPYRKRQASDARNLVRDGFRRQMPPTGFVGGKVPPGITPAGYILAIYRRRHVGGEARRVVARVRAQNHAFRDYRLRSTDAGFWPSAVNVPTSPSSTVAAMAPAAAASKGPGSQTKDRFMTLVMIKAAAADPAATPNSAVAAPSARYSSA